VDFALAHSKSAGAIAHGDHEFNRANLRLQRAGADSQTDVFAGYQGKRFGWPNLYTPFNANEAENLQTALFALNHRRDQGGGDYLETGVFHRRHKDDYAFNRHAPLGPVHPFQHTTWLRGGAFSGRRTVGGLVVDYRAEVLEDEIKSTSLTGGWFHSRTMSKLAVVAEQRWPAAAGGEVTLRTGAAHDDTNRDVGKFAPVAELARMFPGSGIRRLHVSYLRTSQVPSYTALNSSPTAGLFRGNPRLGRSAADHYEAGVGGAWGRWTGEAVAFARRDHALVDWTFRRGITARTANPVDLAVTGFEGVARGSWAAAEVVLGYTALHKDADYRGAAVDASFYALNYARHRLTAAFLVRLGKHVDLRVDNAARWQADNLLRTVGGDRALATALGLAFRPPGWRGVELSAQVDNLWNSAYQEVPAVPASPRQISLTAAVSW
jgi:hypothetical protein